MQNISAGEQTWEGTLHVRVRPSSASERMTQRGSGIMGRRPPSWWWKAKRDLGLDPSSGRVADRVGVSGVRARVRGECGMPGDGGR